MSYYPYMVSIYRSCWPQLNRSLRSSSVSRSMPLTSSCSRFMRASTVGPTCAQYISAMPFSYQADQALDRMIERSVRASSIDPYSCSYSRHLPVSSCSRSYHLGSGMSAFDYKVMDYASRLDEEETTRRYINSRRLNSSYERSSSYVPASSYSSRSLYQSAWGPSSNTLRDLHPDTIMFNKDINTYKHYRRSNQTLMERNTREKSPLMSRELDRYYKTERRVSFVGDISAGPFCDFRYYNYRRVPYYGGSDYYVLSKRRLHH